MTNIRKPIANDSIFSATGNVLNGEEFDSGVIDTSEFTSLSVRIKGFQGANQRITSSTDEAQTEGILISDTLIPETLPFQFFTINPRGRYMRFQLQNDTGVTITDGYLEITGSRTGTPPPSTFPLAIAPTSFSPASLSQSVLIGLNESDGYSNAQVNDVGALNVSSFLLDVIRGRYATYEYDTKFGRNPDIDTGSAPEDVWNGGNDYTGHNATQNESIETRSNDNDDTGSLVSSGSATGGSSTTLVDSGATFTTDGVAVGDVVLNDTQGNHGIVASVDSQTQITVYQWDGGDGPLPSDSYRVATTSGTGAAVVKWSKILDADLELQTSVYVILNGTSWVGTSGDFFRLSRGKVVLCGSGQYNAGDITCRQSTTTANVFAVMPEGASRTAIAADTVPAGKTRYVQHLFASMSRVNGSPGSANMRFQKRERGACWETLRNVEVTDSIVYDPEGLKGIVLKAGTDHKWRVQSVSDNNTIAVGEFKYLDISNS